MQELQWLLKAKPKTRQIATRFRIVRTEDAFQERNLIDGNRNVFLDVFWQHFFGVVHLTASLQQLRQTTTRLLPQLSRMSFRRLFEELVEGDNLRQVLVLDIREIARAVVYLRAINQPLCFAWVVALAEQFAEWSHAVLCFDKLVDLRPRLVERRRWFLTCHLLVTPRHARSTNQQLQRATRTLAEELWHRLSNIRHHITPAECVWSFWSDHPTNELVITHQPLGKVVSRVLAALTAACRCSDLAEKVGRFPVVRQSAA